MAWHIYAKLHENPMWLHLQERQERVKIDSPLFCQSEYVVCVCHACTMCIRSQNGVS